MNWKTLWQTILVLSIVAIIGGSGYLWGVKNTSSKYEKSIVGMLDHLYQVASFSSSSIEINNCVIMELDESYQPPIKSENLVWIQK